MSRYAKFYYFDSFTAIGEKNSGLFKGGSNEVNDKIVDIIVKWNQLMFTKCEQGLKEAIKANKSKEELHRKNKIVSYNSFGSSESIVCSGILYPSVADAQ